MKKQSIVKNSKDFDRIIKKRQGKSNKYFIINKEDNNENINLIKTDNKLDDITCLVIFLKE